MFIQTELTPNPNSIKFFPESEVAPNGPVHFSSIDEAVGKSTLAVKLFAIHNVQAVFFGEDFITITKSNESDWDALRPEILMTIMDYSAAGLGALDHPSASNTDIDLENLSEIEKQIYEIIETKVRPSVAMDGGDITYRGFENGIVKLQLRGSCSGCPSASITLKNGIESMLKHFVPEVEAVEAVDE